VRRLNFDSLIADAINRYKLSLRVIGSLRFDNKCDKSLKECIRR
jgi:hypothetical protein